jgi:hypothetical protein
MYENERDLSSLHLPLELGDIFACENREGQPNEFILLGQPCDLMVRTRDGRRRIEQALVAQISRVTPDKQDGESMASFRLPYYVEGGGHAWVKFPKHFTVPLWVLDLCVFTDNARATFQAGAAPPPGLSDAWMKRRALVAKDAERFVTRALPKPAQQAGKTQEAAQPAPVTLMERVLATPFVVARAQLAPVSLEVGCQRIQRLLRPYAADMLTKFGHYLSRTAFEVDLGEGTLE